MNNGALLALLTALLWAIAVIFFKKSGERVHAIALNLFKDVLAFLLFIPTSLIAGQPLLFDAPGKEWVILAISGFMGICIADTLFFYCLQLLGASVSSIINCLYSPGVIFFSVLFLGERLTTLQAVGVAAIVIAVALAAGSKRAEHLETRKLIAGLAAGIGAVVTSAIGIVMMKPILEHSPIIWVSEIRLFFGIIGLFGLLILHPARKSILRTLLIKDGRKFTIIGSFIGAYLALLPWAAGFKYGNASTTSALQQSSYLLIFIMAVIFLKEKLTSWKVAGIVLGTAGVYMVTFY